MEIAHGLSSAHWSRARMANSNVSGGKKETCVPTSNASTREIHGNSWKFNTQPTSTDKTMVFHKETYGYIWAMSGKKASQTCYPHWLTVDLNSVQFCCFNHNFYWLYKPPFISPLVDGQQVEPIRQWNIAMEKPSFLPTMFPLYKTSIFERDVQFQCCDMFWLPNGNFHRHP